MRQVMITNAIPISSLARWAEVSWGELRWVPTANLHPTIYLASSRCRVGSRCVRFGGVRLGDVWLGDASLDDVWLDYFEAKWKSKQSCVCAVAKSTGIIFFSSRNRRLCVCVFGAELATDAGLCHHGSTDGIYKREIHCSGLREVESIFKLN